MKSRNIVVAVMVAAWCVLAQAVCAGAPETAFRASEGVITRDCDRYALPRFPVDTTVSLAEFQRFFTALMVE